MLVVALTTTTTTRHSHTQTGGRGGCQGGGWCEARRGWGAGWSMPWKNEETCSSSMHVAVGEEEEGGALVDFSRRLGVRALPSKAASPASLLSSCHAGVCGLRGQCVRGLLHEIILGWGLPLSAWHGHFACAAFPHFAQTAPKHPHLLRYDDAEHLAKALVVWVLCPCPLPF